MTTETEAHIFFRDHVQPAIRDWQADETAIHKAMLVATNLAHMTDYYWKSYLHDSTKVLGAQSLKDFRGQLENSNPDYALIRDVCDAHKHLELNRSSKRVTKADQTATGKMGWGEAEYGVARWGSPEEIIVVEDSGEKHHFIGLVGRAEAMWQSLLI